MADDMWEQIDEIINKAEDAEWEQLKVSYEDARARNDYEVAHNILARMFIEKAKVNAEAHEELEELEEKIEFQESCLIAYEELIKGIHKITSKNGQLNFSIAPRRAKKRG